MDGNRSHPRLVGIALVTFAFAASLVGRLASAESPERVPATRSPVTAPADPLEPVYTESVTVRGESPEVALERSNQRFHDAFVAEFHRLPRRLPSLDLLGTRLEVPTIGQSFPDDGPYR